MGSVCGFATPHLIVLKVASKRPGRRTNLL
jgi:hypothetical protein